MLMRAALSLLLFLALAAPAEAATHRVVFVHNADSLTIEPIESGSRAKVHLYGIECPELDQPSGETARGFVQKLTLFKEVTVRPTPQNMDGYDITAIVEVPGMGDLQSILLSEGLAWVYPQFCADCETWAAMQAQARIWRKGLWADKDPVEPWEWRKNKP